MWRCHYLVLDGSCVLCLQHYVPKKTKIIFCSPSSWTIRQLPHWSNCILLGPNIFLATSILSFTWNIVQHSWPSLWNSKPSKPSWCFPKQEKKRKSCRNSCLCVTGNCFIDWAPFIISDWELGVMLKKTRFLSMCLRRSFAFWAVAGSHVCSFGIPSNCSQDSGDQCNGFHVGQSRQSTTWSYPCQRSPTVVVERTYHCQRLPIKFFQVSKI